MSTRTERILEVIVLIGGVTAFVFGGMWLALVAAVACVVGNRVFTIGEPRER